MSAVAELRYVALKPLPVQVDGERQVLQPGEEIPAALVGPWVELAVEAEKVAVLPRLDLLSDEELVDELTGRGFKVKKG